MAWLGSFEHGLGLRDCHYGVVGKAHVEVAPWENIGTDDCSWSLKP